MSIINEYELDRNLRNWLEEDMPFGDITSDNIFDYQVGSGDIVAKEDGIICGIDIFRRVYSILDEQVEIVSDIKDGEAVKASQIIGTIKGPMASILKGERLGLNLMQRLSGIASMSHKHAKIVENYPTKIVDTRKTTPGLRNLEKYAVKVGGCSNHRYSLSDAVMIKDNHIAGAGSIKEAVSMVKEKIPHTVKVEVEVENLDEVSQALDANVDIIMLDNMTNKMTSDAIKLIRANSKRVIIEASGNMTIDRLVDVAKTGVDIISIGGLTHSVKAMDISLKFKK